ncbi:hypothetical protein PVAG01_08140 [Phlyctema vagabunda]|uniref:Uncharacterized protein n=1 Tax=Phlyctema vagabunda TaxID=108571 RepID=A0ABR4P8K5_9HELO
MFVEKTGASIEELKAVFEGDEYATKTQGTSQVPAVTPFAEGIYAITSTNSGRDSHLAYHLTTPSSLGEIQKTLGLVNPKGSYAVSLKNPEAPGPANATLSNPAEYPAEIQDQFSGRRWMPLIPAALEYDNTQFLVIGEGEGDALEEAKDGDERKETAEEEMEKLEDEDEERIQHLKGDDPVFADLGLSSEEFKGLQTTW